MFIAYDRVSRGLAWGLKGVTFLGVYGAAGPPEGKTHTATHIGREAHRRLKKERKLLFTDDKEAQDTLITSHLS